MALFFPFRFFFFASLLRASRWGNAGLGWSDGGTGNDEQKGTLAWCLGRGADGIVLQALGSLTMQQKKNHGEVVVVLFNSLPLCIQFSL